MTQDDSEKASLSIGAVSRATGIPSATLRTWERRYGFPDPDRSDSGHRRYVPDVIERLRLIELALDQGCRPSDVVGLPEADLESIVDSSEDSADSREDSAPPEEPEFDDAPPSAHDDTAEQRDWLDEWMGAVRDLDGNSLRASLRSQWNRLGGLEFLEQRIAPFLIRIGRAWRSGNLEIAHEHHVSEQLNDFLSSRWRPLSERASGPTGICATVPGEDHAIGLHIAALVLAMANWRVVFLGSQTPAEDIVSAADWNGAGAAVISFSSNFDEGNAIRAVSAIRSDLDDEIHLVVGGAGAPPAGDLPEDVHSFESLEDFYDWAFEEAASDGQEIGN